MNIVKKMNNLLINISYFIQYQRIKKDQFKIMSSEELTNLIVNEGYSLCRFGDGELRWAFDIKNDTFQKNDKKMAEMLKKILLSNQAENPKTIIAIYECMNNVKEYNRDGRLFWRKFMVMHKDDIIKYIPKDKVYGPANITRPYIEYKNKDKKIMENKFNLVKKIWDKKDVVIVEGKYTKLGVDNDLFNNCNSIKRIICPAKDAFFKYDEICKEIKKQEKNKLILLALGPTATIIAYYLSLEGYQCIDIGHIDIEYMWFRKGCKKKEQISGKYVQEAGGLLETNEKENKEYRKEIIAEIN